MRKMLPCTLPLLALAACHADIDLTDSNSAATADNGQVAISGGSGSAGTGGPNHVSIDVPGFSANVTLPKINLGEHTDFDGIRVAPATDVKTFDVVARDHGDKEGTVRVSFTNTQAPAALIDYYARAAVDAGYGDVTKTATTLSAKKEQKTFALDVSPDGAGSRGTITVTGED